jgi:hypothetical protein
VNAPLKGLPDDVAAQVRSVICRTIADFRESGKKRILDAAALEMFKILIGRRAKQDYPHIESVRHAVRDDAETALECVASAFVETGFGQIPEAWQDDIAEQVLACPEAQNAETAWWRKQADRTAPLADSSANRLPDHALPAPPRHHRSPDTPMARRIEAFRQRMEEGQDKPVLMEDLAAYCKYSDLTMLQRVQREAGTATSTARANVERMLKCGSIEQFWATVEANRKTIQTRRK